MIRFLFFRLIVPVLILFLLRSVFRSIFSVLRREDPQRAATNPSGAQPRNIPPVAELKKDPVCGIYVPAATSVTRTVNGSVVYFCSPECRDKYGVA
jgi:YHS domain-containing protein